MTKADWRACKVLGRALLDKHGLTDWRISVEGLSYQYVPRGRWMVQEPIGDHDSLAYVETHNNIFESNIIHMRSTMQRKDFRQTLLHEIAHVLTSDLDHSITWARKAFEIGCTWPNVCSGYLARRTFIPTTSDPGIKLTNWQTYEQFVRGLLPLSLSPIELRREPYLAAWGVTAKGKSNKKRGI